MSAASVSWQMILHISRKLVKRVLVNKNTCKKVLSEKSTHSLVLDLLYFSN